MQLCHWEAWEGVPQILQYGYGDESNSLHVVFDQDPLASQSWTAINRALDGAGRPYALAVQTALTATPMWGPNCTYREVPWIFDPTREQAAERKLVGLLLRCDEPVRAKDLLQKNVPYYSAYIWVMFEICDPENRLNWWLKQTWRRYLPVFEHGNIADGITYLFLKRALVRKAIGMIQGIEKSFAKPDGTPTAYYRYVF